MHISIGELRNFIREAVNASVAPEPDFLEITANDFVDSCSVTYEARGSRVGGRMPIFVPMCALKQFELGSEIGEKVAIAVQKREQLGQSIFVSPALVLGTVKKDRDIKAVPSRTIVGLMMYMIEAERKKVIYDLAYGIAEKFEGTGIDLVIPVGSTVGTSVSLAQAVAKILGVECSHSWLPNAIEKSKNPEKYKHNRELAALEMPDASPEKRAEFIKSLEAQDRSFANRLARGDSITSTNFRVGSRRLYDILDMHPEVTRGLADNILVVDDNIRQGHTFDTIEDKLRERGVEKFAFAAGYRLPL